MDWLEAKSTPRYNYCLFVDDICLESMDYPGVDSPVVKILDKDWGPLSLEERDYTVYAPFHDGVTEHGEEDVGWMYLPVLNYLWMYDCLTTCEWFSLYMRPPWIVGNEQESELVGHWRKKGELKDEPEPASEVPL